MAGTRLLDVIVDVALFACHNGVSLILTLFNIFPNPYPVQCISNFPFCWVNGELWQLHGMQFAEL